MLAIRHLLVHPVVLVAIGSLALVGGSLHARAGVAAPADTVTEIHYSFGDSPDSLWFDWAGQEQDIFYGPDTSYGQLAVAGNAPVTPVDSSGPFRQVELTGLQPNSTYHYKIGLNGVDHTFQTIPEGDFTWVDIGDTGTTLCEPWMAQTHQLVAAQNPSFVTHGGDISYANECGAAAVHQYYVDQQAWSDDAAFEPVWGNHEYGQPNSDEGMTPPPGTPRDSLLNYKGRSFVTNGQAVPSDTATRTGNPGCGWETGATSNTCQGNDWGWFQAGHVLFISYPEPWPGAYPAWQAAADQLMAGAQADPNVDFIVTYGHRPAYSSVASDVDPDLRTAIDNLAMKYSPSASNPFGKYVLNVDHHVHWEEVFKPIDGLVNITNGGGGAGQTSSTTLDPNSIFHVVHPAILSASYSAAQHSLTVSLLCGPAFTPNPKATCAYGSVLYTQTFARPTSQPGPAQLATTLTDSNSSPQVGGDIAYTVGVGNQASGSVAQGVTASITLPANESVINAGGGTVIGQTVSWNLGSLLGGQAPATAQLTAQLQSGIPGDRVTATAAATAADGSCQTSGSVCAATDVVTIAAPPSAHQWVTNPSVETDMTGWAGRYGPSPYVTVTLDSGAAHSGTHSLKVTGLTGASNLSSGFNDGPRWVLKTVAGTTYTQSAWVDPTFVGQRITMRLREWNGANLVIDKAVTLTAAATGWQQLTQTLTAAASGDQLAFVIYGNISAGQYFYADDFSLTSPG
jgi:hypothetical protein